MKEPYVGTIDLLGGEIAEDVAAYFVESEQIPTACGLGVLVDRDQSVKAAGGYLIQLLPGADEDTIVKVEGGIMAAGNVSAILDKDDDPEHMLRQVMSDFDLKILEPCRVPLLLQPSAGGAGADLAGQGRAAAYPGRAGPLQHDLPVLRRGV